jgi:hypothetical protein
MKIIFNFLLLFNYLLLPQSDTLTQISAPKIIGISAATVAGFTYGHLLQEEIWWKGQRTSFHFNWSDDWTYSLGGDKLGHFYFPYLVTNIYTQAFEWSGMNRKQSLYTAASIAFAYQTYIEIRDGFSAQYGFSWGDFTANLLGAAYPILQDKNPFFNNFNWKISFHPSNRFKQNSHRAIIDDYESTYHWLTLNIFNLLPEQIQTYFPEFINLTIGHSVANLDYQGRHEIFIGLDWNLEALPGDHWLLKLLKRNLNYYRIPAPVIRLSPDFAGFGFKF